MHTDSSKHENFHTIADTSQTNNQSNMSASKINQRTNSLFSNFISTFFERSNRRKRLASSLDNSQSSNEINRPRRQISQNILSRSSSEPHLSGRSVSTLGNTRSSNIPYQPRRQISQNILSRSSSEPCLSGHSVSTLGSIRSLNEFELWSRQIFSDTKQIELTRRCFDDVFQSGAYSFKFFSPMNRR